MEVQNEKTKFKDEFRQRVYKFCIVILIFSVWFLNLGGKKEE